MLRVELTSARPGMTLALPIRNPRNPSQVLLRGNHDITSTEITRLTEMGVRSLWVRYPSLDFLDKYVSQELITSQGVVFEQVSKCFEQVQSNTAARLPFESYCKNVGEMVAALVSNPQAAVFMGDLSNGANEDLLRHSSTVTFLSVLMGLKLEGYLVKQRKHIDPARAKEVNNLGVGAMLHDLGIPQLSPETRKRYQTTQGDESDVEWQEHPRLGYQMVRGRVDPSAATVVLNHHQRIDGSGYAGKDMPKLDGQRIHVYARIVGLAEYFDRQCNPLHQPRRPAIAALQQLAHDDAGKKFDNEIRRALFTVAPPFPPGSIVQLSDGRWAAIVDHCTDDPCRPTVQIIPAPDELNSSDDQAPGESIELIKADKSLKITHFDEQDVSSFNFTAPAFLSAAAVW